jgi:hypothetical protein
MVRKNKTLVETLEKQIEVLSDLLKEHEPTQIFSQCLHLKKRLIYGDILTQKRMLDVINVSRG